MLKFRVSMSSVFIRVSLWLPSAEEFCEMVTCRKLPVWLVSFRRD